MNNESNSTNGVGVAGLLGVLFIGLKLGHVIDWHWLWVLSPFWIPLGFALVLLLIAGVVIGVAKAVEGSSVKKARIRNSRLR